MKKIDFTKEYLDKIISPIEVHSVKEYADAITKLWQIMDDLKMDYYSPDFYPSLEEYKDASIGSRHIGRITHCTNYVIEQSLKILQNDTLGDERNIEEKLKDIWYELIGSFDYSADQNLNIYDICMFKQALYVFEQAVKSLASNTNSLH